MSNCLRCGLCCIACDMVLEQMTDKNKMELLDRAHWLNLHRCDSQVVTKADGRQFIAMRVPLVCIKLDQDKEGKYYCKDYNNRPELCKKFLCERAKA